MPKFIIQEDLCRKDGICGMVCPGGIITASVGQLPAMVAGTEVRCIGCGQCVAFCPSGAASLVPHEPKDDPDWGRAEAYDPASLPSEAAVAALLRSRRSIRVYKETPVPPTTLEKLMQTVRFAPTATNAQRIRWVLCHKRDGVNTLGGLLAEAMREAANADPDGPMAHKFKTLAQRWADGKDPYFRGAPHLLCAIVPNAATWRWGVEDGSIALTYAEIMAHGMGIGACWAGYFTAFASDYAPLRQALGLKDDERLAGAQMLGFPRFKAKNLPYRPLSTIEWR